MMHSVFTIFGSPFNCMLYVYMNALTLSFSNKKIGTYNANLILSRVNCFLNDCMKAEKGTSLVNLQGL